MPANKKAAGKRGNCTLPTTMLALTFRELSVEGRKSWRNCWIFAQFAADNGSEEMERVCDCFRKLRKFEQEEFTPEKVCELAGVSPREFAMEVFAAYLQYAGDASRLVEAANRPEVVRKTVQFAKKEQGWRDRQMLHTASGFLPSRPGGGNIQINASASANSRAVLAAPELPTMESDTMRFTRALKDNTALTIEAPAVESLGPVASLGEGSE